MSYNRQEYGYSQMLFNYITDYSQGINEAVSQMEFIWQNRDNFKEDIEVEEVIKRFKKDIEEKVESFLSYLEPLDEE
ncbi:hypothetical protein AM2_068 [Lactococcus phage AM2]|uniref:Uncharacterized protein n=7 Tax=Audreyjarvisvirus AM1 TaxID=2845188 RepID=A0A1W6JLK3_9CAUD|nr:hypothetical protein H1Z30_gp069 [Lactococcus phage AM1]ARM66373.1 hypothetical protein AM2_068 [Lactococcus phage AM2]ARM66550.1 hypothetical protein AM3_068 [Lactococcus phage AM3]ARM67103.1 hypothetical protein AM8_068 [Lactococcus phage AM8]ARM67282.1 hypothetical protein AM9_069 [Lactococcus phage AM9]ARM67460.1 hypothetical protein AM11_068 [Lactococcus phage AM11]ARQ95648.1 hypothetical protein AM12_069 [Lactococcus phage AM12]